MKTHTRLAVAALAAAGVAAAALAPLPAVAGDAGTIVIALEAPLTGSQSANGKDMLRGAQLAAMQVVGQGEERRYQETRRHQSERQSAHLMSLLRLYFSVSFILHCSLTQKIQRTI